MIKNLLLLCLILTGCTSYKVVVERKNAPQIRLPKEIQSIEVQLISNSYNENFTYALNQSLIDQTSLKIIHSQNRNELIDAKLRGDRNRQNNPQADLIIRGHIQENIEEKVSTDGSLQYAATSRPYLQLIKTSTGEVILSKYFVGTSLSQIYRRDSNTSYDGYTDSLNSARNMAIQKFINLFAPQTTWIEIDLLPLKDKKKFDEIRNLISYGKLESAKEAAKAYLDKNNSNGEEKGKAMYSLSVIESLMGNFQKARDILHLSHELYPHEKTIQYFKEIDLMETEAKKTS